MRMHMHTSYERVVCIQVEHTLLVVIIATSRYELVVSILESTTRMHTKLCILLK